MQSVLGSKSSKVSEGIRWGVGPGKRRPVKKGKQGNSTIKRTLGFKKVGSQRQGDSQRERVKVVNWG